MRECQLRPDSIARIITRCLRARNLMGKRSPVNKSALTGTICVLAYNQPLPLPAPPPPAAAGACAGLRGAEDEVACGPGIRPCRQFP